MTQANWPGIYAYWRRISSRLTAVPTDFFFLSFWKHFSICCSISWISFVHSSMASLWLCNLPSLTPFSSANCPLVFHMNMWRECYYSTYAWAAEFPLQGMIWVHYIPHSWFFDVGPWFPWLTVLKVKRCILAGVMSVLAFCVCSLCVGIG